MVYSSPVIDREAVHDSFRQWQAEQAELDAQLVESVAALVAYQSHLDAWQRELAAEREELQQLRSALEHDQAFAQNQHVQSDQIQRELNEAQQKISSLTGSLLTRTEELRELDRKRAEQTAELTLMRVREKELMTAVEAEPAAREEERQCWEAELIRLRQQLERTAEVSPLSPTTYSDAPIKHGPPQSEPTKPVNPVLGTVMEQFDKLRQQRSTSRPQPLKPR